MNCSASEPVHDGVIEVAIQHPDLSSSLTAPQSVSVAVLRSIICQIEFSENPPLGKLCHQVLSTRKRRKRDLSDINHPGQVETQNQDVHVSQCLTPSDEQAMDAFLRDGDRPALEKVRQRDLNRKRKSEDSGQPWLASGITALVHDMLNVALQTLLLGKTSKGKALRVQNNRAYALVELAPAVFNFRHLQVSKDRPKKFADELTNSKNRQSPIEQHIYQS